MIAKLDLAESADGGVGKWVPRVLVGLRPLGFAGDDPGGLYRALRALESDGFVHSAWEPSPAGPDRRIYELTRAGMEDLHRRSKSLVRARATLDVFLSRYGEFVALDDTPAAARSSR